MLEFDGQALDPAIVSAQPMKPVQTVDLQQMGGPSSECQLIYSYSKQIDSVAGHCFCGHMILTCSAAVKKFVLFFSFITVHPESRLPQTSTVSGPQESSQVSRVKAQQQMCGETQFFCVA